MHRRDPGGNPRERHVRKLEGIPEGKRWLARDNPPLPFPSARMGPLARLAEVVQRRGAWRAGVPARVDPDPLVGVAADYLFDDFCKAPGVRQDVLLVVSGANKLDGGLELETIFPERGVPNGVAGDDGRVRVQSNASDTGGGTRRLAKKIHESALAGHGVLVGENADGAGFLKDSQHRAGGLVLEDGAVAGGATIAVHKRIEPKSVDGASHVGGRRGVEGVGVGRKLPRSNVPGEIENPPAAPLRFKEMVMAAEDNVVFDVPGRVLWHAGEFGRHPRQIANHAALDFGALRIRFCRKGNAQIDAGRFAQLRQAKIQQSRDEDGQSPGDRPRQVAESFQYGPKRGEFEPGLHAAALIWVVSITGAGTVCRKSTSGEAKDAEGFPAPKQAVRLLPTGCRTAC